MHRSGETGVTRDLVIMSVSTARVVLFVIVLLLTIVALVGISVSTGASDVTVDDAYSSILRKLFPDRFESEYIVTWDDVPGSDSEDSSTTSGLSMVSTGQRMHRSANPMTAERLRSPMAKIQPE